MRWSIGPVHGPRLHIDRGPDVVPATHVEEQVLESIRHGITPPQVMVWVDDGQPRLDDVLADPVQPRVVHVVLPDVGCVLIGFAHVWRSVGCHGPERERGRWKTSMARCERGGVGSTGRSAAGIHATTVYVGGLPGDVRWSSTARPVRP